MRSWRTRGLNGYLDDLNTFASDRPKRKKAMQDAWHIHAKSAFKRDNYIHSKFLAK